MGCAASTASVARAETTSVYECATLPAGSCLKRGASAGASAPERISMRSISISIDAIGDDQSTKHVRFSVIARLVVYEVDNDSLDNDSLDSSLSSEC
jgi:hypothetical protein